MTDLSSIAHFQSINQSIKALQFHHVISWNTKPWCIDKNHILQDMAYQWRDGRSPPKETTVPQQWAVIKTHDSTVALQAQTYTTKYEWNTAEWLVWSNPSRQWTQSLNSDASSALLLQLCWFDLHYQCCYYTSKLVTLVKHHHDTKSSFISLARKQQ